MTIPLVDPKDKLLAADFLMEAFTASVFWGVSGEALIGFGALAFCLVDKL